MRIGLFSDTYPPFINGVSTSVLMLKKALEKLGHTVYVVTVNPESMRYDYDEENKVLRIPGVPIGLYDYRLTGIYPLRAINIVKKWNLDVIHSHTEFGIGTFSRLIGKQLHIPIVHTYHTMYEDYIHYITKGYFDKSSKKIVEYLTLFYCDKTASELVVPTKKTYDLFKEKYKIEKNINIIPTGIEIDRFFRENIDIELLNEMKKTFKIKKNDFVSIFVGRLAEEKNIEFLLDVQNDLMKKHNDFKFIIVGDGPDFNKYKDIIKKYALEDRIIMTGKIAWEEIPYYYHMSNVFLTASMSETQGLTVIEAMASELIPICINDESFKTVVTDGTNGRIFNNKEECINIIMDHYNNIDKTKIMARQARLTSERYSSKNYAESILDVYNYVINKKDKSKFIINKIIDKIKDRNDD
ncbi:MAG: glycosyltransferase [Bacilli bacterium]|nr:glycosyltransferase [Bacilli bacterium]